MRVAIVHDSLCEFGGAERVLGSLIEIWPQADVFTSAINLKVIKLLPEAKYTELFLNKIPLINKKYAFLQLLSPLVWKSLVLKNYDLIISSSTFGLSNTINPRGAVHVAYLHRPPKNLYGLSYRWTLQKIVPYSFFIKKYYEYHLKKTKNIITSSKHMQGLFKKMFRIKAKLIYPPVNIPSQVFKQPGSYFVISSRLDKEKSVDMAIRACNQLRLPLKVLGIGKELKTLQKIAGPTIQFLRFVSDKKRFQIYSQAKVFIFCAKNEDFGIAPIEAMAQGLPVIAYYGGGLKETVIKNKTGLFYYEHSVEALIKVIEKFNPEKFNPQSIHQYAKKFSEGEFKKKFRSYVLSRLN